VGTASGSRSLAAPTRRAPAPSVDVHRPRGLASCRAPRHCRLSTPPSSSLDATVVTRRRRRVTSFAFPSGGAPTGASLHLRLPLRRRRPRHERRQRAHFAAVAAQCSRWSARREAEERQAPPVSNQSTYPCGCRSRELCNLPDLPSAYRGAFPSPWVVGCVPGCLPIAMHPTYFLTS
jgi:hypothetical protein